MAKQYKHTLKCSTCKKFYNIKAVMKDVKKVQQSSRYLSKDGTLKCKKCRYKIHKHHRKLRGHLNKVKYQKTRKNWQLKKEYEKLFELQGNVCGICKQSNMTKQYFPDHDHISGKVQGILCKSCNMAIGVFKDNQHTLHNAVAYLIRAGERDWDTYFMSMASLASTRSKDLSTQVGAVIVKDKIILSTGYNGFPRGVNDLTPERHQKPEKYNWVVHAEENAIYNASRMGIKLSDSTIYITQLHPCTKCAKAIIQAGIKKVIIQKHRKSTELWDKEGKKAAEIFLNCGITIKEI